MAAVTPCLIDLPWLAPERGDFEARLGALGLAGEAAGVEVLRLAQTRLQPRRAAALGRAIARLRASGNALSPLSGFRLGVLASATYDLALDGLPAACARHGVLVDIVRAPYGQVMQQALDPASEINAARPDAVLVAVDHRWMGLDRPDFSETAAGRVAGGVGRLREAAEALLARGMAPILQTLAAPPGGMFGSFDRRAGSSVRAAIDEANRQIIAVADQTGAYLLDVAALAEEIGAGRWFDPVQWFAYKLPFSAECGPAWAEWLARLLGAIRGRSRKCLVLDLDNTLWGGVVGDDGMDGIVLGQGGAVAESFLAVQHAALDLRRRGVLLAVCSKNDEAIAREPFRDHPDMVLREHHISVFQANWIEKANNLEAIAMALNIGVDALVLLDDNPAERAQVRAALPAVAVPELPEDPAWYAWTLGAAGYFEAVSVSTEDLGRADAYGGERERGQARALAGDLGDYLSSLGMVVRFSPFDALGRQRIVQLINKTNQFNLTTRRYTEPEVASMERDPSLFTLQVRLRDRFGDTGMTSVVICRPVEGADDIWEIDTWLMSCRVLGRELERAVLDKIVEEAARRRVRRLVGEYMPTPRNGMVADHYGKLGFSRVAESDGQTRWELDLSAYEASELPMSIEDGFAAGGTAELPRTRSERSSP